MYIYSCNSQFHGEAVIALNLSLHVYTAVIVSFMEAVIALNLCLGVHRAEVVSFLEDICHYKSSYTYIHELTKHCVWLAISQNTVHLINFMVIANLYLLVIKANITNLTANFI